MINDLQFPTYLSDNGRISHSSPSGFSIFSLPTIHFSTHRLIPLSTTLLPNLKCVTFKVMCPYNKYIFYFAGITPDNILTEYFHLVALLPSRTQPDIVEITSIAAPAITEKQAAIFQADVGMGLRQNLRDKGIVRIGSKYIYYIISNFLLTSLQLLACKISQF